jgi:pyrroloquinoline quinone (PQQ) biosynthesis protein C
VKIKQIVRPDSFWEQKRRNDALQSDLLRIVGALGMSRSLLQNRSPWDNASRDPNEYEPFRPYDKEQTMIRDVVRVVAERGTDEQCAAVRKAVTQFYETKMRDALEFLGEESETDVIALTLECNREVTEAECALTTAIASKTPESHVLYAAHT